MEGLAETIENVGLAQEPPKCERITIAIDRGGPMVVAENTRVKMRLCVYESANTGIL